MRVVVVSVERIVGGDVLQIARDGIEAQSSTWCDIAQTHLARRSKYPTRGGKRGEVCAEGVGHGVV
jgi:hypothetical protein